ncbi:single-stranded DNA-binding protein [Candidatus Wolfebacteria bacterium]|nr:single-stranded DNA-binding protein [Candidatus Wolfebacteria bacterium]
MYINKVFIYGNLTRDPEVKALPSGSQVASFSVATNRTYKDQAGQQQDQVEYHNITMFGRQAEVAGQYLKKGRPVYIEGRLQTRNWEKDGVKHYRTEVIADRFQFGPSPRDGAAPAAAAAPAQQAAPTGDAIQYPDEDINPEDIPF